MFDRSNIKIGKHEYEVLHSESQLKVNGKDIQERDFVLIKRMARVNMGDRYESFVVNRNGDDLWLLMNGREYPLVIETDRDRLLKVASQNTEGGSSGATIRAAMPGLVVRIAVKVGQTVKRSDPVLILEAMKMENEVRSPADGVVKEIRINERDSVDKGTVMVVLE